jgi:Putative transposase DNA-binding domain
VVTVDPAYTSQTGTSCGVLDTRSRESQAIFYWVACGHRDHGDADVAKNIRRRWNTGPLPRREIASATRASGNDSDEAYSAWKSPAFTPGKMLVVLAPPGLSWRLRPTPAFVFGRLRSEVLRFGDT